LGGRSGALGLAFGGGDRSQSEAGKLKLFKRISFPGGHRPLGGVLA
jgi:hypothetical protein